MNILPLLGLLFIGLKLTAYLDWSWWWVTAPFWGPLAIVPAALLAIAALLLPLVLIAALALGVLAAWRAIRR